MLAALPAFVAATLLMSTFSVRLGWFPAFGNGEGLFDRIRHLTLPAIALAGASMALVARVTRTSVRGEVDREHVQTAVSRGLPRGTIIRRHVLRNAAIPITTVAGITIASLIALAAVVERAFSLNGLGSYLVAAAASKDFAVVQGISLVLVTVFVVLNTIVDLLYALLDPRVKLGSAGGMSSVVVTPDGRAPPRRRRRGGIPGLRGTGVIGHVAAAVIVLAAFVAVFGSWLTPHDPDEISLSDAYLGSTTDHWLGLDSQGRDILSRLLVGARASLLGPLIVVVLAIVVGAVLAIVSAWRGGVVDSAISSVLDILFAFPGILLAVLVAAVFGPSLTTAALALAVAYTPVHRPRACAPPRCASDRSRTSPRSPCRATRRWRSAFATSCRT